MGYAYSVRFRIHPANGPDVTYDLTTLSYTAGPVSHLTSYAQEKVSRATPNRRLIERRFGCRPIVKLGFEIPGDKLSEEARLADVATQLMTDGVQVFLSLDGGITEREVTLASNYDRSPLAGKALAGLKIDMEFECSDLIQVIPPIGTGAW